MSDVAPESGAAQLPLQPQIIPIPSDSGPPPSAPTAARTIRGGRERGGGYRRRRDVGATRSPTSVVAPNSRGRFDGLRSSWWFDDVVPEEGFGRARRLRLTLCRRWGGVRSSGEKNCRLLRSAGSCSGTRPSAVFHPRQCGAGGGIRTLTLRRMGDFESPASAIPPLRPDDHSHPHRLSGQASIDGRTIQVLRISHSRPRRTSDRRPIQSAAMTSAVSASRARAFGSTSGNGKSPSSLVGMRWMWT